MRDWWPAVFAFALLAAILLFVFLVSREPEPGAPAEGPPPTESALTVQRFYELLEERQLKLKNTQMACPIDGTVLQVPELASSHSRNRFGGVATDLMSISLAPPTADGDQLGIEKQDWEVLLVTCPECGATYHGIDLFHLRQATSYRIEEWDLAAVAPGLAARPSDSWTTEERIYVRLLTQRAAGVPAVELGFTALQGAYAANFGTWYGKTVRIPSAAFYALAAAYFGDALASDNEMKPLTRASTALPLGECYRLLGRSADAAEAFALVHSLNAFDESRTEHRAALAALTQLEQLLAAHDYSLQRAEIPEFEEPPLGWYIEAMLPAINGHLTQHRSDWASIDDPAEIHSRIAELIAQP